MNLINGEQERILSAISKELLKRVGPYLDKLEKAYFEGIEPILPHNAEKSVKLYIQ